MVRAPAGREVHQARADVHVCVEQGGCGRSGPPRGFQLPQGIQEGPDLVEVGFCPEKSCLSVATGQVQAAQAQEVEDVSEGLAVPVDEVVAPPWGLRLAGMGVSALNMAPSMESGKRVRVSRVVEYSVPPTFRVTGPPKEGGGEGTGGGEILGVQETPKEKERPNSLGVCRIGW